ncbi:DUF4199 domain-containing protein [Microvirga pakistanensis]|uniref:DUF4199 domain-containing protein n=1 Tax=Microvirga pakistanensis TaxID=1682650 RepID=UPI00106DBD1D|nr:DUF4199 domain-containing protein [Microvirga pakistanensis]
MASKNYKRENLVIRDNPVDFVSIPGIVGNATDKSFIETWNEYTGMTSDHRITCTIDGRHRVSQTTYTHNFVPRAKLVTQFQVVFTSPEGMKSMICFENGFLAGDEVMLTFANRDATENPIAVCNVTRGIIYEASRSREKVPHYTGINWAERIGERNADHLPVLSLAGIALVFWALRYFRLLSFDDALGLGLISGGIVLAIWWLFIAFYRQGERKFAQSIIAHAMTFSDTGYVPQAPDPTGKEAEKPRKSLGLTAAGSPLDMYVSDPKPFWMKVAGLLGAEAIPPYKSREWQIAYRDGKIRVEPSKTFDMSKVMYYEQRLFTPDEIKQISLANSKAANSLPPEEKKWRIRWGKAKDDYHNKSTAPVLPEELLKRVQAAIKLSAERKSREEEHARGQAERSGTAA